MNVNGYEIFGESYSGDVRFYIEYENGLYAVAELDHDINCIFKAKWSVWRGLVPIDAEIPDAVWDFARIIKERHGASGEKYPLRGESYRVRLFVNGDITSLGIRPSIGRKRTMLKRFIPGVLRALVAIIMAQMMLFVHQNKTALALAALFPSIAPVVFWELLLWLELLGAGGLLLLFDDRQDLPDLLLNALLPIGLVISAVYMMMYTWMWLIIPLLVVLMYFLFDLLMPREVKELKGRAGHFIYCLRLALGAMLIALMIMATAGGLDISPAPEAPPVDMSAPIATAEEIEALERRHEGVCAKLHPDIWKTLEAEEKLAVLQEICDYECLVVLGCERVTAQMGDTGSETTLGVYTNTTRSFVIKEEHLRESDVEDVLETALHETRHAYQYSIADMYARLLPDIPAGYDSLDILRAAKRCFENHKNYITYEADPSGYYNQYVERDSRNWSKGRINEYYYLYMILF